MNSKKIQKHFFNYLENFRGELQYATIENTPAVIYGNDEFKIDIKKNRIRLPDLGWLETENMNLDCSLKDIKWIAIKKENGNYNIIAAIGINPYDEIDENPLYENNQVFAVPASLKIEQLQDLGFKP